MVLKKIKEKSFKNKIEATIASRTSKIDNSVIKTLGFIVHTDEFLDDEFVFNLAKKMNINPNTIRVLKYSENKTEEVSFSNPIFTSKDFSWNGAIKNREINEFLNRKFDALISFYKKDNLELKLLTSLSKAKFKIGLLESDVNLNDLTLNTSIKNLDLFEKELLKYLNVLNKLNTKEHV